MIAARATLPRQQDCKRVGKVKIRHLVTKHGAAGPLHYWQPSAALRALGWQTVRLPDLRVAAIARAEALNAEVDSSRRGEPPPRELAGKVAAIRPVVQRTLGGIIALYERSRFFTELRGRSQRGYRQNMTFLAGWGGDIGVAAITPRVIEKLYSSLRQRTPSKARAVITMLRILLSHARREGWVATNAAEGAGLRGASAAASGVWPRAAVQLFVAAADEAGWHSVGTAVAINHWLGQRQGDILALPRTAIAGGRITLAQSKTGARVSIPENPAVAARIAAELAHQAQAAASRGTVLLPPATLLVCEATGRPWKEDHFRHVFGEIRARLAARIPTIAAADGAAMPTTRLLFMQLRHTAVTEMSIAGCTTQQICGVTGHSIAGVDQILRRYLVRTSDLADAATAKRTAYDTGRV